VAVTLDDVRHIASLDRLELSEARAALLVGELNRILEHIDVLSKVDTSAVDAIGAVGLDAAPMRADVGPPIPLARPIDTFAPRTRDGFFLVPRLSTHEDNGEASS
jgi:aspartyl-tRNA(Asn)/glutamyl-tRNA(Gln) amidotransferase subunit C